MINENQITISKKARYYSLGNKNANKLLIVLHGYGQLASYFIQHFEVLKEAGFWIVAPEATHRFYLHGSKGRVGASWMTKDWRLQDIEDTNAYLETFLEAVSKENNFESISLLGFSQGGATASRWIVNSKFKFEKLILWACDFPKDVLEDFQSEKILQLKKYFVLGNEDEFYAKNKAELVNLYTFLEFTNLEFTGRHKIDQKTLNLLFD